MGFVAEAAAHLFEEFEVHGVLTAEFFLDDDRLLGGIKGKANTERTRSFESVCGKGRLLAERQSDANAQLALALSAGLRADYLSIIEKSQVASLREIRAADGFAERLLEGSPKMTDAYVALGCCKLYPGLLTYLQTGRLMVRRTPGRQTARDGATVPSRARRLLFRPLRQNHAGASIASRKARPRRAALDSRANERLSRESALRPRTCIHRPLGWNKIAVRIMDRV